MRLGLALALLAAPAGVFGQDPVGQDRLGQEPPGQAQSGQAADTGERWAVQVVALRDYREAQAAANDLRTLGFDSYTEFAMLDAQQWVRVRVGCFASREAADAMALALRAHITAQAQAVELSPGARVSGCTQEVVGFLNAYGWRLTDDDGPVTFSVTVAGVPATVAHDGTRWRVVQEEGVLQAPAALRAPLVFAARRIAGVDFVGLDGGSGPQVVCPGELVASVADVAIVVRGELLVACRYLAQQAEVVLR